MNSAAMAMPVRFKLLSTLVSVCRLRLKRVDTR